jgi:hypothetical protein
MSDSVHWIAIFRHGPDGGKLHVINEERDFYSTLDENRPRPFLKEEWKAKKHAGLYVCRTLSSFLKDHFDGVVFSYDKDTFSWTVSPLRELACL